jgi:hypothetical protein
MVACMDPSVFHQYVHVLLHHMGAGTHACSEHVRPVDIICMHACARGPYPCRVETDVSDAKAWIVQGVACSAGSEVVLLA